MTNLPQPRPAQLDALTRLIAVATDGDDGDALCAATFLLAWDDAPRHGGFDFRHLWGVEDALAADIRLVIDLIVECPGTAPYHFGFADDLTRLAGVWRRPDTNGVPQ